MTRSTLERRRQRVEHVLGSEDDELLQEQRVALRHLDRRADDALGQTRSLRQELDERSSLDLPQIGPRSDGVVTPLGPRLLAARAARRRAAGAAPSPSRGELDEVEQVGRCPVQVLEQDDQRPVPLPRLRAACERPRTRRSVRRARARATARGCESASASSPPARGPEARADRGCRVIGSKSRAVTVRLTCPKRSAPWSRLVRGTRWRACVLPIPGSPSRRMRRTARPRLDLYEGRVERSRAPRRVRLSARPGAREGLRSRIDRSRAAAMPNSCGTTSTAACTTRNASGSEQ